MLKAATHGHNSHVESMVWAHQTFIKASTKRPAESSTFGLHMELWMGPWGRSHQSPETPINSYALITVRSCSSCTKQGSQLPAGAKSPSCASGSLPASQCSTPDTHWSSSLHPRSPWHHFWLQSLSKAGSGSDLIIHLSDTCRGTKVFEN